jgi:hypothetical protein
VLALGALPRFVLTRQTSIFLSQNARGCNFSNNIFCSFMILMLIKMRTMEFINCKRCSRNDTTQLVQSARHRDLARMREIRSPLERSACATRCGGSSAF